MRPVFKFLLHVLVVCCLTPAAFGQPGGYVVTATLNPFFTHPDTGEDLTGGRPLRPLYGLRRGADGWFYGLAANSLNFFTILRVSPTTGAAQVIYAFDNESAPPSEFYRGRDGRFYFTIVDYGELRYAAPGYSTDRFVTDCSAGCVLMMDTTNGGATLSRYYDFYDESGGWYPRDGLDGEDTAGAIYVGTTWGGSTSTCYGGDGALVKIRSPYDSTVLEVFGCDPPFDWHTVSLSHNNDRHWSDGFKYESRSADIVQVNPSSGTALRLATISPADGVPIPYEDHPEGSGYIYGVTCCGGGLNGGVVFRIRVPSLATPDLVVSALAVSPSIAAPGTTFNISDTTLNAGPEPAGKSVTSYYLSFTGSHPDLKLTGNRYIGELWPTEESSGTIAAKIPPAVADGTYWLLACADAALQVAEHDDGNNCRSAGSTVVVARPDLVQMSVGNPPGGAAPGSKIAIADSVRNNSAVEALASTTRYYLSLDTAKGSSDVLLMGKRAVPSLPAGATSTDTAALTIPSSTPVATYYVLACADDLSKVIEASESNNCAASTGRVAIGFPDLVTTAVVNPPAAATIGGQVLLGDTVANQGAIAADKSATRYYLSSDQVKSVGDVLLTGKRVIPILAPGASSSGTKNVTVPLTARAGTFYVLACADDAQKLDESNEANNCRASATTVVVR